ncbi:hypothetical protein QH494_15960 [Sphingomonas sp. AR_OL41]|uniref:hypothetical protein n=1 Tax=Sphingomonas sp. AR_OL41 TaxID=3042729 RepID=UPI00248000FC|nr:hypothetical protein [Sphingomonas sp. AR_OL41]MDH7973687.1 hypothetical protein [Sphingomonas sp. AR_OL41]
MGVSITTCNLALGELRAPPIADISEDTIEARECARYYPQVLRILLERHDWSFANRRATLAQLATNDRPNEWSLAYAMPTDVAKPLRLAPAGFSAWPSCDWTGPASQFLIENGTLYTNVTDAVLEYSAATVDDGAMTGLFVDALAFALAARLAVPLRDSPTTKGQMLQQAEIAFQRAVAEDRNRQPQRDTESVDEVGAARMGGWPGAGYC